VALCGVAVVVLMAVGTSGLLLDSLAPF